MNKNIFDMFDNFEIEPEDMAGYNISADRISERTLQKLGQTKKAQPKRRKIFRIALIAAVIACFMSVTAYAAAYFNMHYRYVEKGGTYSYRYWTPEGYMDASYTVSSSYIVSFDTQPDGYMYVFRPTWVPLEPTAVTTVYGWAEDEARFKLGMAAPAETQEEKTAVKAGTEELLSRLGMTAQEAETWYTSYDADQIYVEDVLGADIPYKIELYSNSDLYNGDFAIGDDPYENEGVRVDFVKDEVDGDWHEIWAHVDETETEHSKVFRSPLDETNFVLRFNLAKGYLVYVPGTLDFDTLHKIAENVEVLRTELRLEIGDSEHRRHDMFTLGHG